MGFVRNVGFHIILHCNTTKCNAAKGQKFSIRKLYSTATSVIYLVEHVRFLK
jgi:hypothetical protein